MNGIVGGCIVLMAVFLGLFAVSVAQESDKLNNHNLQGKVVMSSGAAKLAQGSIKQ
jgi:hypothetical protein